MSKYKVWQPSGEDEDNATEFDAVSSQHAAEQWAERHWCSDDGTTLELRVKQPTGVVVDISVDVNFEPSFCAHSLRAAS